MKQTGLPWLCSLAGELLSQGGRAHNSMAAKLLENVKMLLSWRVYVVRCGAELGKWRARCSFSLKMVLISRLFQEFCRLTSYFCSLKQDKGHKDAVGACVLLRKAKTALVLTLPWVGELSGMLGLRMSCHECVIKRSAVLRGTLCSFLVFQTERHPQQPSASPLSQLGAVAPEGSSFTLG